ncbi:hypothetical protein [Chryseobacterium sp. SC28]|uniref:hypothetical protein n=1 Tax=Chryseobacterium sp. SC28 TaxID=2268028 RepID=UPI000F64B5AC|nr:hypothetical protein [Chryseobacterium sp. SC28]RRQ45745.1 hypothetical protein DTW91_08720 [Chryseobacterium sp. SC28]
MKNLQLIGLFLVVAGSFLPLVHIPIVGNWNYWKVDNTLAIVLWGFSLLTLVFILIDKTKPVRIMAFLMIFLFVFTIVAIKLKSLNYFSFLPFKSWQSTFAGIVKLSWGWFIAFLGAVVILLASRRNINADKNNIDNY